MNNDELNEALYKKMSAELAEYRSWVLKQPPEKILKCAYGYSVREDIVLAMDQLILPDGQAAALLSAPSPLCEAFNKFGNIETDYLDTIRDCIFYSGNDLCKVQQELPIYPCSGIHAQEHGESDAYRTSFEANIACKKAIERAISANYHDNSLDSKTAVQEVTEQFGIDRTLYVLAATVQEKESDGRISRQNKQWAKTVPVAEDIDTWNRNRTLEFAVDGVNPGLVDIFLNQAKKEQLLEHEPDTDKGHLDWADQKHSIKEQLASPPVPGSKPSTKPKDREVR